MAMFGLETPVLVAYITGLFGLLTGIVGGLFALRAAQAKSSQTSSPPTIQQVTNIGLDEARLMQLLEAFVAERFANVSPLSLDATTAKGMPSVSLPMEARRKIHWLNTDDEPEDRMVVLDDEVFLLFVLGQLESDLKEQLKTRRLMVTSYAADKIVARGVQNGNMTPSTAAALAQYVERSFILATPPLSELAKTAIEGPRNTPVEVLMNVAACKNQGYPLLTTRPEYYSFFF